ncbi:MAG: type II toxin-antitoxin system VapC family toxin [Clostridium sp.]|nr:type II toxin-antitoxin system VapC family toxin [Clostridium sp.]
MLDTNILVSMIFFPSEATGSFAKAVSEYHRIIICDYVIEELRLVTRRKFPQKMARLNQFFLELPFEMVYMLRNTYNGGIYREILEAGKRYNSFLNIKRKDKINESKCKRLHNPKSK